jgi:CBS domain-containing protein
MYTTITVKQVLERKGSDVWSIDAEKSVFDALQLMTELNIGALLVVKDDQLVGIFSERDYARKLALKGKNERDTMVREVMTDHVIGVNMHQKIEECLALMTNKFIRHLPVVDDDKQIVGVISIGDLVKELTAEQAFIIDQLVQYIAGEAKKPPIPEKSEVELT